MTSHRDCTHPKTKAARTLCRKIRAALTTKVTPDGGTFEAGLDLKDPQKGQYLKLSGIYFWIDEVQYGEEGAEKLILINREGQRSWVMVEELTEGTPTLIPQGRSREQHEAYSQYISDGIGDTDGWYIPIDFEAWAATFGKGIVGP